MRSGNNFVITEPDGTLAVYANIRNVEGFRACMAGTGRKLRPATDADLEACGITALVHDAEREIGASIAFGAFVIAKLPAGSNLQ